MPEFEPTGDLLTDLQSCIDTQTVMQIDYVDGKGNYSTRTIAPLEIRDDRVYGWSLEKDALRLFILANIQGFQVLEETFDKEAFS